MIRRLLSPPLFEKEEENFRARFINGFAWVAIVLLTLGIIPYLISPSGDLTVFVPLGLIVVMLASLYFLRRRKINESAWIVVILGWLGIGVQAFTADGVKDVIIMAYVALGLLASIVISHRAGTAVILSSIGVISALALLEANGLFQPRAQDPIIYGRDLIFIFITITTLIYFLTTSLKNAILRANKSDEDLRSSNQTLQELNQSLEQRVTSRTAELELANQRNERRARQFESIAEVARAITSSQNLNTLLTQIATVISREFGYYHVGVFLLDSLREYAILSGTNSEGGQNMLIRGHRLRVGETGIVGYVTAKGKPRVALDTGTDAVYFDNPDLPETRSEVALPLRVGGEIIGALDVQSTQSGAFSQEDVVILTTLADQVSIAIQNATQFDATRKALSEAESLSRQFVQQGWVQFIRTQQLEGVHHNGATATLLYTQNGGEMEEGRLDDDRLRVKGTGALLSLPVKLRGEVIGSVDVRSPDNRQWDQDELDIVTAIIERSAIAMENARLLAESQRIAAKEHTIGEISAKISSQTDMDELFKTTLQELNRALPGAEIAIQFRSDRESE